MTIKEIAEHLDLDWKTVKEIYKRFFVVTSHIFQNYCSIIQ